MIDFDIDSLKEKPWVKKGENVNSFFNYGFTEDTWKVYQLEIKGKSTDSLPPPPVLAPRSGPPPVIQSTGVFVFGIFVSKFVPSARRRPIRTTTNDQAAGFYGPTAGFPAPRHARATTARHDAAWFHAEAGEE